MNKRVLVLLILVPLVFLIGYTLGHVGWQDRSVARLGGLADAVTTPAHAQVHEAAAAGYVCPMHPQVTSEHAGTCPICGMALVKAHRDQRQGKMDMPGMRPTVQITSRVIQNLGVRTTVVKPVTLVRSIEMPGFVQQIGAGKSARVRATFDGRVVSLPFKPGAWLEPGSPLVVLASETLLNAEQAYLDLLDQARDSPELDQSRRQLAMLGLSATDIQQLEKTRKASGQLTLAAPFRGMVMHLQVKAGDPVKQGASLFQLMGMARASVLANAFQRDAAWIRNGNPVTVRLPHVSHGKWQGLVTQAAVSIDPNSQNIGVRLSFDAPMELLKSAMYVVSTVHGDAREHVLAVPSQALIRTQDEDRVILALGDGRFKPVPVQLGMETTHQVEILQGLKAGDRVVTSAQFLIDSESSLQAAFTRMTAGNGEGLE